MKIWSILHEGHSVHPEKSVDIIVKRLSSATDFGGPQLGFSRYRALRTFSVTVFWERKWVRTRPNECIPFGRTARSRFGVSSASTGQELHYKMKSPLNAFPVYRCCVSAASTSD